MPPVPEEPEEEEEQEEEQEEHSEVHEPREESPSKSPRRTSPRKEKLGDPLIGALMDPDASGPGSQAKRSNVKNGLSSRSKKIKKN